MHSSEASRISQFPSVLLQTQQENSIIDSSSQSWEGREVGCLSTLWDGLCKIAQQIFDQCCAWLCCCGSETSGKDAESLQGKVKIINIDRTISSEKAVKTDLPKKNEPNNATENFQENAIDSESAKNDLQDFEHYSETSTDESFETNEKSIYQNSEAIKNESSQMLKAPTFSSQVQTSVTITKISGRTLEASVNSNLNSRSLQGDASCNFEEIEQSQQLKHSTDSESNLPCIETQLFDLLLLDDMKIINLFKTNKDELEKRKKKFCPFK